MEWLKDKAWTLVLLVVVGLGGSVVGYQKGKLDKQVETLQANVETVTQTKEKQDERQDKADEAGAAAEIALAKACTAAELTGERKAAAERERVYTELLSESTRLVEVYARAADFAYERGLACQKAWPE